SALARWRASSFGIGCRLGTLAWLDDYLDALSGFPFGGIGSTGVYHLALDVIADTLALEGIAGLFEEGLVDQDHAIGGGVVFDGLGPRVHWTAVRFGLLPVSGRRAHRDDLADVAGVVGGQGHAIAGQAHAALGDDDVAGIHGGAATIVQGGGIGLDADRLIGIVGQGQHWRGRTRQQGQAEDSKGLHVRLLRWTAA